MTGIVLSASVRQNLLSLQSTASLLATTQNDLATGNKVNSALDNPTNFFTAQSLNNRASDISNLLDGIGNGVQVLQAANTGITSLQSLVASAQSIANQVLQSPVGYSTKSSVTSVAVTGATANNLLGTLATAVKVTGSQILNDNTTSHVAISANTQLVGTAGGSSDDLQTAVTNGSTLTVDGKTITFSTGSTAVATDASGNVTIGIGSGSTLAVSDVLSAIDTITGAGAGASTVDATGHLVLSTGTTQNLAIAGTGNALAALGLSAATTNVGAPLLSGETLTISCDRRRHRDLDHLRHGQRSGLDAERAQRGAGGQQPAGHHRLRPARSASRPRTTRRPRRSARSPARRRLPARPSTPSQASARLRSPMQACRRRVRAWWRSTTTCWRRLTPPRRTRPSTASTC